MAFTRHGHQIIGTTVTYRLNNLVAQCGGPKLCAQCKEDVDRALSEEQEKLF